MLVAQRPGVQPPRARSEKQLQKPNDLVREAVGLQRHVSRHIEWTFIPAIILRSYFATVQKICSTKLNVQYRTNELKGAVITVP